ncbi:MAG: DUF4038 domain-containing protein [Maribacter sp.]|uniref:apiosidase-like domain-containing protein n=1 Tax=Maribacter sp. TaxID=1897614 RepID=UPI003C75F3BE
MKRILISIVSMLLGFFPSCQESLDEIPQWTTYEITLTTSREYPNPYTDVDVWGTFTNQKGDSLVRPAFWDGENTWKIRFAPIDADQTWTWTSFASNTNDAGLNGQTGTFKSIPYSGNNRLIGHGPLKMTKGHRNLMHHSGKSFLMVGDTPWAIPFRATKEQVDTYAKDRQQKGFNAALMMTLQPDTKAEGPNERNVAMGFKRAFSDLSEGHLSKMNIDYFQYYDSLVQILIDHEIVPVYQPVFHGFGWKGLQVLGSNINPQEYVRYTKYLLARYGSMPAIWLIAGDHNGKDPGVQESGEMLDLWDCYQQPVGIHYNPCDDYLATWANGDRSHCFHYNKSFQDKAWLDFQWAQTGHDGEHLYHKVERMYDNKPTKAVANGEPTYEGMNNGQNGLGWWQGEEAWMQLMHGGTMGVVYGAASLWQWKVTPDEKGWDAWTDQPLSWEGALHLEGSTYVGLIGKITKNLDIGDIEKRWDLAEGKPILIKEGALYISFLKNGGELTINGLPKNMGYTWIDPKTGLPKQMGIVTKNHFKAPDSGPWVLVITK